MVEVFGQERDGEAEREAGCQNEAIAAVKEDAAVDNGHARNGDCAEEESGHAAKNGGGDGDQGGGELGEDSSDDEEEATEGSVSN